MSTFSLPDLGEGLQEAEIVAWHVAEGDHVVAEAPLVSVETEKAVVEVPSPRSGYVKRLIGNLHERIKVGTPIVEFDDAPHVDTGTVVGDLTAKPEIAAPRPAPAVSPTKSAKAAPSPRIAASPAVRALARERDIDLTTVVGTGPNDAITRADVERAASEVGQKTTSADYVPLRGMRRSMAINMAKAHAEVVPATIWDEADVEAWWSERSDVTVRLIRSIVAACATERVLNSWFDGKTLALQIHDKIDLGLAVDLEGGLIVPVLRDVASKDATALRGELDQLKAAVRARSVPVADLRNPTITLSNFGMMAGRQAALIVMPPQVAIIGAGKISPRAVPEGRGEIFRRRLPLSLTFDHRAVTGGEAGRFLKAMMEDLKKRG